MIRTMWLVALGLLLFCATDRGRPFAQSQEPSRLPLLEQRHLQYLGAFRVPDAAGADPYGYEAGGRAMAYNPATNTLYLSSERSLVAEITIPAPVNSEEVKALPFARFVQSFADPTEGRRADIGDSNAVLYGLLVYGNRLYGSAAIYYDANNTQRVSHFSRSLKLTERSFSGWSQVWETAKSGYVSGMMAHVPAEWQSMLGGPALTAQCCIPIVSRTSNGPSAFAFNPSQIGQPVVSAVPLLYYVNNQHDTLGPWAGSNATWGATADIKGFAAIAGTRTVLYFGRNGVGPFCYGNGTSNKSIVGTVGPDGATWCFDPTAAGKAQHAYPYKYQIWAYDMSDLAAVRAGRKRPWAPTPYGVWTLDLPVRESEVRLGGVAYDEQRQVVYVVQLFADQVGNIGKAPLIHAFRIALAP